jgi:hypothetical protein
MTQAIPYLLQGKNIILVVGGKSHTISKDTHINYGKIVDALKAKDWDALVELVEPAKAIVNFGKGYVKIENGVVYWKGSPFNNALSSRMIEMYQDGFPIDPMVRFMENLMANPSKRSVDQVYGFLEKNNLPITEDGHFLAFKKVQAGTYKDIHSGTIDNSIGQVVEMDRNLVDDNPDSHCSTGLHFCSISYLSSFGGNYDPIMILKINPADVVSIPTDYNGAKGRCMKYEVIAEVDGDPAVAFAAVVDKTYDKPKAVLTPQSPWPFAADDIFPMPGKQARPAAVKADTVPVPKTVAAVATGTYMVQRMYGGNIEAKHVTLDVAREMVAKNVRQKKAMLVIIDSNGKQVV